MKMVQVKILFVIFNRRFPFWADLVQTRFLPVCLSVCLCLSVCVYWSTSMCIGLSPNKFFDQTSTLIAI